MLALLPSASVSWAWEEELFRALNKAGADPILDAAMFVLTTLGLPFLLALLAVPLWARGKREAAVDLLVLLVVTMLVTDAIKILTARARPCDALAGVQLLSYYPCAAESDPAFPSGHTSRAFAVAGFLLVRISWRPAAPMAVLASLIGLSRIYLGVHWPTDVVAGAGLGIVLGILFVVLEPRVRRYGRVRAVVVKTLGDVLGRLRRA